MVEEVAGGGGDGDVGGVADVGAEFLGGLHGGDVGADADGKNGRLARSSIV